MPTSTPTKSTTIQVSLPPLHTGRDGTGGQQSIANHPARFKVVMCGRRWGKTFLGVYLCAKTAIEGGRAWWVAPNYKIANEGWSVLKTIFRQIPGTEIRESDRQILVPG